MKATIIEVIQTTYDNNDDVGNSDYSQNAYHMHTCTSFV